MPYFLIFSDKTRVEGHKISVAKGPKFRPQRTKRAEKKLAEPGKSGAELLPDLSKKGQKRGQPFFKSGFT
jgi:hypothetical protein